MKLNNIIDLNSYIRISSIRENFEENCLYIKDFDEIKNLDLHNCNNIIFENSHLKTAFFDKLNLADIDYTVINCLSSVTIFEGLMTNIHGIAVFDNVCSCRSNEILDVVINYKNKKLLVC